MTGISDQGSVNLIPPSVNVDDFENRAVKVAKALNLIAGDGKTNVYKANSLDSSSWNEETSGAFKKYLSKFKDKQQHNSNKKELKYFDFEVLW